jgi:hypothetical protein
VHGLASHLFQYPTVALATASEHAAAERLAAEITAAARGWTDPVRAAAAGYKTKPASRRPGDLSVHYLHAERRGGRDDGFHLDPLRPKAVIYANAPGRPLELVGVMFSMRRGVQGPTPGGPITRWHWHRVCVRGNKRGIKPQADGSCPAGARLREGSEMMHFWLTGDLRSAFAIHAPEPELCAAGLLPATYCRPPGRA